MTWCYCTGTVQSATGERNGEKLALNDVWPSDVS